MVAWSAGTWTHSPTAVVERGSTEFHLYTVRKEFDMIVDVVHRSQLFILSDDRQKLLETLMKTKRRFEQYYTDVRDHPNDAPWELGLQ